MVFALGLYIGLQFSGYWRPLRGHQRQPPRAPPRGEHESLHANELLDFAMTYATPERGFTCPVLRDGNHVGLLTAENVGEFVMIRTVLEQRRNDRKPPKLTASKAPPVMSQPAAIRPGMAPLG